jgi:lipopolysaccharide assembly protein B
MDFELSVFLLGVPIAFALGWLASRLDRRQLRRESRDAPRAYFKGLNLLLNEQPDKAIDAFIEAVQNDPDTTELHFALGNLFRRRGEFERAVRVHQHLLQRGDLPRAEHDRAQHALAQDFMKAGLFDRAEAAYQALDGSAFETDARLSLLGLYERSRDWRAAIDVAQRLEKAGTGSFAARVAHYWCELAQEAADGGHDAEADDALRRAREAAPHAPRPLLMQGRRHAAAGRLDDALAVWAELRGADLSAFSLVATDYAQAARSVGRGDDARALLQSAYDQAPGLDLLQALRALDDADGAARRLRDHLQAHPTLSAAQQWLQTQPASADAPTADALLRAVADAARPLHRYRCAACGFEAQQHFWQCPGCLAWDSYPTRRIEEL